MAPPVLEAVDAARAIVAEAGEEDLQLTYDPKHRQFHVIVPAT